MRIVVCLRFGFDVAELRPDRRTGAPRLRRAALRLDPFSHNALEEAVRLKERHGGRVILLSVVPAEVPQRLLLEALAGGADEAFLVVDPGCEEADAHGLTGVLGSALRHLAPWELVLCGDASADRYERQIGPRLAEALDLPCITRARALEIDGATLRARRSLEDRIDRVQAALPAVVTVTQEANEPRLPPLLQVMGAGSKPCTLLELADLGLPSSARGCATRRLETTAPPTRRRRQEVRGQDTDGTARELVRLLAAEGLVHR
jgi:electron transfer flavoprotein beta subunit